ncbi:MAG: hypothetical protein IIZ58_01390 [Desulfovibrio sp.]|nr:hypothetical protein [Desulfovibrio sp.]
MSGVFSVPPASLKAVEDPASVGLMTCADVAAEVGVSVRAVQKWAASGWIEAVKPNWCGVWLIPMSELSRVSAELGAMRHGR